MRTLAITSATQKFSDRARMSHGLCFFVPEHGMSSPTSNITDLLRQAGDPQNHEAWEALYQAVGSELHRMARRELERHGRGKHDLQTAVLIDEVQATHDDAV
jgi:hypothetical protein